MLITLTISQEEFSRKLMNNELPFEHFSEDFNLKVARAIVRTHVDPKEPLKVQAHWNQGGYAHCGICLASSGKVLAVIRNKGENSRNFFPTDPDCAKPTELPDYMCI